MIPIKFSAQNVRGVVAWVMIFKQNHWSNTTVSQGELLSIGFASGCWSSDLWQIDTTILKTP